MSDADWQAFINDRQGAIVGQKLVKLHGFTPGQRITLKSPIYNQSVEFIIRGVYTGSDEKTLYFHHDYLNELLPDWAKDQASTFQHSCQLCLKTYRASSQAIDSIFANTDAPTKTESEREFAMSFQTMMGGVKQFLYGIMAAITFSLLLVMGNTMAMTVRERTKEVGTLKAIGFQRGTITALFLGEALIVACIGAAIGIGAAVVAFQLGGSESLHSVFHLLCSHRTNADRGVCVVDSRGIDQRGLFGLSSFGSDNRRSFAEH